MPGPFLLRYSVFVFSFSLFFVYVPCARLRWPSHQLSSARKYTVSCRIVSSVLTDPTMAVDPDQPRLTVTVRTLLKSSNAGFFETVPRIRDGRRTRNVMVWRPSVFLSVCLSVCPVFFL